MVNALDFHPVNLSSIPAGTYMSRGWRQEEHRAKISPVR